MTAKTWYLLFDEKKELLCAPYKAEVTDITDLKMAVKEELENVKARDLVVWRCKEPLLSTQDEDELQELLSKIDFRDKGQVVKLVSGAKVASLGLGEDEVLLVQVPGLYPKKRKLEEEETPSNKFLKTRLNAIKAGCDAPNPSSAAKIHMFIKEQSKDPVWNGRPYKNHAEPIGLYHPVFNEFQDAMKNTEPFDANVATYDAISDIFGLFSKIYPEEKDRVGAINGHLRALLGRQFTVVHEDGVRSDGVVVQACGDSMVYLVIMEAKNEIGTGQSDPYNQGSLAYRKYWASQSDIIKRCCCPSIILAIAGPWLCVLGGVYVDKVITQRLTNYVWLGGDPFETNEWFFIARLFTALKTAISRLDDYYKLHVPDLSHSEVGRYPFITEYGAERIKFTYLNRPYEDKLLYFANLDDEPDTFIVVKFVQRYNADAHRLLAAQDLAPKLRYCGIDDNVRYGNRSMIVMDYSDLRPSSSHLTEEEYERVEKAIKILHENKMVFGDLRLPNILVGDASAMLIDFDWCGKVGQDRYPPEINRDKSIGWHPDVGPGCCMYPDHDIHMLKKLKL